MASELGTSTIDFGTDNLFASITVPGQGTLAANDYVEPWIQGEASIDHNAYTHATILRQVISLTATNIVAGVSFDIFAMSAITLSGQVTVRWVRTS